MGDLMVRLKQWPYVVLSVYGRRDRIVPRQGISDIPFLIC